MFLIETQVPVALFQTVTPAWHLGWQVLFGKRVYITSHLLQYWLL
jgi:hypothetical protein